MEEIKKFNNKYVIFFVLFIIFSIVHVTFLINSRFLSKEIYSFYILLYVIAKIFMFCSVFTSYIKDKNMLVNQCILSIIIDLSIVIIYVLYIKKVVFLACVFSIIEFLLLLEIRRHIAYNKPENYMLLNILYSLSMIIIAVCFMIVFTIFAFTNVQIFKEITTTINATIENIQSLGKIFDDAKNTIDDFSKNLNGFSDNIENIGDSIESGIGNLFKH